MIHGSNPLPGRFDNHDFRGRSQIAPPASRLPTLLFVVRWRQLIMPPDVCKPAIREQNGNRLKSVRVTGIVKPGRDERHVAITHLFGVNWRATVAEVIS